MLLSSIKIAHKYKFPFRVVYTYAKRIKREQKPKEYLEYHFYSKKIGILDNEYLTYLEKYKDKFDIDYYVKLTIAKEYNLNIEEADDFYQNNIYNHKIEDYKEFLIAKENNVNNDVFNDYLKTCKGHFDINRFIDIYLDTPKSITYLEYHEYLNKYKSSETLTHYINRLTAEKNNIFLEIYELYLKTIEKIDDFVDLETFSKMVQASKLSLTLEEFNSHSNPLKFAIKKYDLTDEDINENESRTQYDLKYLKLLNESKKYKIPLKLMMFYDFYHANFTSLKEFIYSYLSTNFDIKNEIIKLFDFKYELEDFIRISLEIQDLFSFDVISSLYKNNYYLLETSKKYNYKNAFEIGIDYSLFDKEAYELCLNLDKGAPLTVDFNESKNHIKTIFKCIKYFDIKNVIFKHYYDKAIRSLDDLICITNLTLCCGYDTRYFPNLKLPYLNSLHIYGYSRDISFRNFENCSNLEELLIECAYSIDLCGFDNLRHLKNLIFIDEPVFTLNKKDKDVLIINDFDKVPEYSTKKYIYYESNAGDEYNDYFYNYLTLYNSSKVENYIKGIYIKYAVVTDCSISIPKKCEFFICNGLKSVNRREKHKISDYWADNIKIIDIKNVNVNHLTYEIGEKNYNYNDKKYMYISLGNNYTCASIKDKCYYSYSIYNFDEAINRKSTIIDLTQYEDDKIPKFECYLSSSKKAYWIKIPDTQDLSYNFYNIIKSLKINGSFSLIFSESTLAVHNPIFNYDSLNCENFYINNTSSYTHIDHMFDKLSVNNFYVCSDCFYVEDLLKLIHFKNLYCYNRNEIANEIERFDLIDISKITLKHYDKLEDNVVYYQFADFTELKINNSINYIYDQSLFYCLYLKKIIFEGNTEMEPCWIFGCNNVNYIDFGKCKVIDMANPPLKLNEIVFGEELEEIVDSAFRGTELSKINGEVNTFTPLRNDFKLGACAFSNTKINIINLTKIELNKINIKLAKEPYFKRVIIPSNIKIDLLKEILTYTNLETIECDYSFGGIPDIIYDNSIGRDIEPTITVDNHIKILYIPNTVSSVRCSLDGCDKLEIIKMGIFTSYIDPILLNKAKVVYYDEYCSSVVDVFKKVSNSIKFKLKTEKTVDFIDESITITNFENIDQYRFAKEIIIDTEEKTLPDKLFFAFPFLKKVTFKTMFTKIPKRFFYGCSALVEIEGMYGIEKISSQAFKNCSSLQKIDFKESLKYIGSGCFENCINLESIEGLNEVETINSNAFRGCHLIEFVIPPKVNKINDLFRNCSNLKCVKCYHDLENLNMVELNNNQLKDIYLPANINHFNLRDFNHLTIHTLRGRNFALVDNQFIYDYIKISDWYDLRDEDYQKYNYEITLAQYNEEKAHNHKSKRTKEQKEIVKEAIKKQEFDNRFTTVQPRASWNLTIQEASDPLDIPTEEEIKIKYYDESHLDNFDLNIIEGLDEINNDGIIDESNINDINTNIFTQTLTISSKLKETKQYISFALNNNKKLITNVSIIKPKEVEENLLIDINLELNKDVFDRNATIYVIRETNDGYELIFKHNFAINITFAIDSDFDF